MLPCNVVAQEASDGIEVAAIDPVASMQTIQNEPPGDKAAAVAEKLRRAILSLAHPSGMAQSDLDEHRAEIERHADESRHELDPVVPPGTDSLLEGPR